MDIIQKNIDKLLTNSILSNIFIVFIAIYCVYILPNISKNKIEILKLSNVSKIIAIAFIFYIATKNLAIALIMFICFVMTNNYIHKYNVEDNIIANIIDKTSIYSNRDYNKVKLINKIINNNQYDDKLLLAKNVVNSSLGDHDRFNTLRTYLRSNENNDKKTILINDFFHTNFKMENLLKITKKILKIIKNNEYIYIPRITNLIINSKLEDYKKKEIIKSILSNQIKDKYKMYIIKKIVKSKINIDFKLEIITTTVNMKKINSDKINKLSKLLQLNTKKNKQEHKQEQILHEKFVKPEIKIEKKIDISCNIININNYDYNKDYARYE
jgi:hypothetical protein